MRSSSSRFLFLAFVAALGCSATASEERREHGELERALVAFSESAPEEREQRLEAVRRLAPASERVREVQRTCLAAYEAFFTAMARLAEVKAQAAEVEAENARAGARTPVEDEALSRMQATALEGTRAVTAALDRAEALVDECSRRRAALTLELGD